MKLRTTIQLSTMMFLQFFIWGTWYVTLGTFLANNLNASDSQIGSAFATSSWGAIIAPFIVGLIADRYFNAERILGLIHLAGGVLLYIIYKSDSFVVFYPYMLLYLILYMPTLALANSVSFRQMNDPSKEFGRIRVWGTIGWIFSGLVISFLFSWDSVKAIASGALKNTFLLGSVASFALALFSLTLPKTPPAVPRNKKVSIKELLGLEALSLLKNKNYAIFFISSILICIPLAFYFQNTNPFLVDINVTNATGKMTIGQLSEVFFMLLIPFFLLKFGIKKTLIAAMFGWVLRYVLFAFGNSGNLAFMLLTGIALHGICYDFFFVSGQIYTDSKAGKQYKSAAQGLITLATYGVGMFVGYWAAGKISYLYTINGVHQWKMIWLIPAFFSTIVLFLLLLFFKNETVESK
jgi:nucleoside transporter